MLSESLLSGFKGAPNSVEHGAELSSSAKMIGASAITGKIEIIGSNGCQNNASDAVTVSEKEDTSGQTEASST